MRTPGGAGKTENPAPGSEQGCPGAEPVPRLKNSRISNTISPAGPASRGKSLLPAPLRGRAVFSRDRIFFSVPPHISPCHPLRRVRGLSGDRRARRAGKGDGGKLDIEEQYRKIYQFCYCRLRNRELAEDMTQETFLRGLSGKSRDLPYLYTTARNLCIDEVRRKKPVPLPEDLPAAPDGEGLDAIAVRMALEDLSEEDRELLLLRYVNGESVSLLCELYGISRFALYRRLRGILGRLREALEEE